VQQCNGQCPVKYKIFAVKVSNRHIRVIPWPVTALDNEPAGSARLGSFWLVRITSQLSSARYLNEPESQLGSARYELELAR
jgi:hypothetical protein